MEALRSLDLTKTRCDAVKHLLTPFVPAAQPAPPYVSALAADTLFQIVAVRDVSRSAISYIERLAELIDANEGFYDRQTKARPRKQKVIRSADVDGDAHEHWPAQAASPTYRLTLQDAHGNLCYAHEIEPLAFLRSNPDLYPVRLGSKLLVQKGATVVFGSAFQLTSSTCRFLGGELPHMNHDLYRRELQNFKREINYTG